MLKKFRKSVKVTEKKRGTSDTLAVEEPYCHACGQRTPIRSTFGGSISSRDGDRISWNSSSASDSGYGSISSSSESRTSSSHVEGFTPSSMASLPPPRRCPTYSSSLYSDDVDHHETAVHPMPITVEDEDEEDEDLFDLQPVTAVEYHEDHFDLPPRTLSNYSNNFTPKSRFARLNQLPVASPRAIVLADDFFDLNAGIEMAQDQEERSEVKRTSWRKKGKLSAASTWPSRLRSLSLGKTSKD